MLTHPLSHKKTKTSTPYGEGPRAVFRDAALAGRSWLVGGRDGVLFSWRHKVGAAVAGPWPDPGLKG